MTFAICSKPTGRTCLACEASFGYNSHLRLFLDEGSLCCPCFDAFWERYRSEHLEWKREKIAEFAKTRESRKGVKAD